jgi:S-DNA-T family DNA segregation ATPase FtsK/SpoIIIE
VLTGLIRANIPTRVAFATVSALESRIILDENGAEELMGPGSGLVRLPGVRALVPFQGVYMPDEAVQQIVDDSWEGVTA